MTPMLRRLVFRVSWGGSVAVGARHVLTAMLGRRTTIAMHRHGVWCAPPANIPVSMQRRARLVGLATSTTIAILGRVVTHASLAHIRVKGGPIALIAVRI